MTGKSCGRDSFSVVKTEVKTSLTVAQQRRRRAHQSRGNLLDDGRDGGNDILDHGRDVVDHRQKGGDDVARKVRHIRARVPQAGGERFHGRFQHPHGAGDCLFAFPGEIAGVLLGLFEEHLHCDLHLVRLARFVPDEIQPFADRVCLDGRRIHSNAEVVHHLKVALCRACYGFERGACFDAHHGRHICGALHSLFGQFERRLLLDARSLETGRPILLAVARYSLWETPRFL